jgi:tetratricopeptide (TPR) repeat protein
VAKNKGKHKSQKTAQVAPVEQFQTLTSRLFTGLRPHLGKIAAVTGGVVLVVGAMSIWSWYKARRDARATTAFGKVVDVIRSPVVKEEPPDYKPDPDEPHFKSQEDKNQAALAEMERLEKDYGSSDVAKEAALVKAGILYDMGRWDEAIAAYKKFLASSPTGEPAYVAKEGLAYAIEAKGLALAEKDPDKAKAIYADALREFERLDPDEKGPHRDIALYHQARVKALMGDKKGAIETYKLIIDKFPATQVAPEINNRLAILEEAAEQG